VLTQRILVKESLMSTFWIANDTRGKYSNKALSIGFYPQTL
jgi:hypothetical protein